MSRSGVKSASSRRASRTARAHLVVYPRTVKRSSTGCATLTWSSASRMRACRSAMPGNASQYTLVPAMPLPVDVHHGTDSPLRRRIMRWWRRPSAPPQPDVAAAPPRTPAVDRSTHAFWSAPRTDSRVEKLVRAHERGVAASPRPRANPAFSEALFVELMRARQYRRAFDQLSSECRTRWGSADAFAAAQGTGALRSLQGVQVKQVRFLPEWTDPDAATTYRDVAELDVEYTIAGRAATRVVPKVVHLVPDGGKWRSLCYPM
jgi:hypothetical protein